MSSGPTRWTTATMSSLETKFFVSLSSKTGEFLYATLPAITHFHLESPAEATGATTAPPKATPPNGREPDDGNMEISKTAVVLD